MKYTGSQESELWAHMRDGALGSEDVFGRRDVPSMWICCTTCECVIRSKEVTLENSSCWHAFVGEFKILKCILGHGTLTMCMSRQGLCKTGHLCWPSCPACGSRHGHSHHRHFRSPCIQLILADGKCRHHHVLVIPSFKRNTLENQRSFCLFGFWQGGS